MSRTRINWGIRDKTVWNWMELLIVPVMLAAGAMYLDARQTAKQAEQENRRREDAERIEDERYKVGILNDYRRAIIELVKDGGLLSEAPESGAVEAAQAITNATLAQLDGPQKGALLSFLFHSQLIGHPQRERPVMSLLNADFEKAVLKDGNLSGAHLQDAHLTDADLTRTLMYGTHFNANTLLEGADLRAAVLLDAQGLSCGQLEKTRNWESALRDEDLACGAPIPADEGTYEIEVEG